MAAAGAAFWYAQSSKWTRRAVQAGAAFISGVTQPTEANVGLSNPALLTDLGPNSGSRYDVSTPGTVIQNKTIKAHFRNLCTTGTVTLRNCLITGEGTIPAVHSEGASPTGYVDLALVTNSAGGTLVLEDCYVEPIYHQYWLNALKTTQGTTYVTRTVLKGLDAVNITGTGQVIALDYVLGPNMVCSVCYDQRNSTPAFRSHNDCVQIASTGGKFTGFNGTAYGKAINPKGDLSTFDGTSYSDGSWGCCFTYSGPSGTVLSSPVFDVDRCWMTPGESAAQCSSTGVGTFADIRNGFVGWDGHDFGGGNYTFRAGTGSYIANVTTNKWSAAAGVLTRNLGGNGSYSQVEGSNIVEGLQGQSNDVLSRAGYRPNGV